MKNTVCGLFLLFIVLFIYGCPKNGPVVYYSEDAYRGRSTFTFTPSFGNPVFKEGWRNEEKRDKDDNFYREKNYAYRLGTWEARMGIAYSPFLGWKHFASYEDGYKRSEGQHATNTHQLRRLIEEKGELDAAAEKFGYPKRTYNDLLSESYYQRGHSEYKVRYEREDRQREETYNYQAAQWMADMHQWEAELDPRIDSSNEYKRLMYNLGVLTYQASKYGYPAIEYPTKK